MKKQLLITAAILMGTASYGYAATENVSPMPFATMDQNGDGFLSKDEVGRRLADRFEQFDIDKNGLLSATELPMQGKGWKGNKGQGQKGQGSAFTRMDKNGDGMLSKDEVGRRLADRFEQLDADGNGSLSATELPMRGKGGKGKGHKGPHFAQMDKNGNGSLSATELPMRGKGGKGQRPTFSELDSDANGTLSESEFAAQVKGRAGKMQNRPTFEEMDSNGDGVLAKEELRGRLLERLQQFDKDGSGTLSKDELPRFQQ